MGKCNRYESLYLFQSEEVLFSHIKDCEECRKEYEEDQKIASLVKEVKPYLNKSKSKKIPSVQLQAVASLILIFLCFFAFDNFSVNNIAIEHTKSSELSVNDTSVVEAMGLPTDQYGLLEIE